MASRRGAARTRSGRASRSSASRRSCRLPLRLPVGVLLHELGRAAEILRGVDREPDALVTIGAEPPLGCELGERRELVVALLREKRERLLAEDVDAGVDPVLEFRSFAEAGDGA